MYKSPKTTSKQPRGRIAYTYTLPAPTKGLNQRDPISSMNPLCSLNMTNFIATPQGAAVRNGYTVRNTGLPGYVNTIATYYPSSAAPYQVFAWSGTSIYNVTTPGAVGAAVVTGLTNSNWSTIGMGTIAGQFLVCANGVDAVRHYNGSSWTTWTNVGSPSNPGEIAGVSVNTLNSPILHQRRLWFVQENSTKAWYLPINSLGGTANSIDYGPVFPRGGKLAQLASWSLDGGTGIKNFLAAVSTNGDLVIYEGTDPSSSSSWNISATWTLAAPTTKKCFYQLGGDLIYNCLDGIMPLSQYMQNRQTIVALSDSIRSVFTTLADSVGTLSGWDINYVPYKNLLVVNIPNIDPLKNFQLVYNTITEGWSLFTGWPAQCWTIASNKYFFGGFQQICEAFSGFKDGAAYDGTGGATYTATAQQAYNYITQEVGNKQYLMARINLTTASSNPVIFIGANTDFNTNIPFNMGVTSPITQSLYNVALWDHATWAGGLNNLYTWQAIAGTGYCLSITVAITVQAETNWISTDIVYENGGIFT